MVKNKRIINLIPRSVQTSPTVCGILPPSIEIANSIKFLSEVRRAEDTTLKDQWENYSQDIQSKTDDLEDSLIMKLDEKLVS